MKMTGMCVSAALMTLWFGRRATHKHIDALLRPEIAGVRGDPIDVYSMIDQRPLGESARAAIQAELNLRFENIGDIVLGRRDIEELNILAGALGIDIKKALCDYFASDAETCHEFDDLYEALLDFRYIILHYRRGIENMGLPEREDGASAIVSALGVFGLNIDWLKDIPCPDSAMLQSVIALWNEAQRISQHVFHGDFYLAVSRLAGDCAYDSATLSHGG